MSLSSLYSDLVKTADGECETFDETFKRLKKYHKHREKFVARLRKVSSIVINPHLYSLYGAEGNYFNLKSKADILQYLDNLKEPCETIEINFSNGACFEYKEDESQVRKDVCDLFVIKFCLSYM